MPRLPTKHIQTDKYKRPAIAGTRLRVTDVALWHKGGMSVAEMVEDFDLTPGQAYAALSYYYDHRDEIDTLIQEEADRAERTLAAGDAIDSSVLRADIDARRKR